TNTKAMSLLVMMRLLLDHALQMVDTGASWGASAEAVRSLPRLLLLVRGATPVPFIARLTTSLELGRRGQGRRGDPSPARRRGGAREMGTEGVPAGEAGRRPRRS